MQKDVLICKSFKLQLAEQTGAGNATPVAAAPSTDTQSYPHSRCTGSSGVNQLILYLERVGRAAAVQARQLCASKHPGAGNATPILAAPSTNT